jgi:hypothetical protein
MVLAGQLKEGTLVWVHIEGGKRKGSGVQTKITGPNKGDLRITTSSAFSGRLSPLGNRGRSECCMQWARVRTFRPKMALTISQTA